MDKILKNIKLFNWKMILAFSLGLICLIIAFIKGEFELFDYVLAIGLQVAGALLLFCFVMSTKRENVIKRFAETKLIIKDGTTKEIIYNKDVFIDTFRVGYMNKFAFFYIAIGYLLGVFGTVKEEEKWFATVLIILLMGCILCFTHDLIEIIIRKSKSIKWEITNEDLEELGIEPDFESASDEDILNLFKEEINEIEVDNEKKLEVNVNKDANERSVILKIDDGLKKWYKRIYNYILGRAFIKLLSEIVLALLIAGATFLGSCWYNCVIDEAEVNKKIGRMYVSISKEYVNELFGVPYTSFIEKNGLVNNFYLEDEIIIRTVLKDEKIIAFFVTSKDENRTIPVNSLESEKSIIGKINFQDIKFPNPICEAFYCGNGRVNYYSEAQGTGRYGMYNTYVYAIMPYGFLGKEEKELVMSAYFQDNSEFRTVDELKKYAKPNTYGVIADEYIEDISIIPESDEWLNAYYLLTNE